MQEVEGSTPTGGTCPYDFSDPIDQDIHTQCALSWKIGVSEWRSVIAVSLNVSSGVIKLANCTCACKNTKTQRGQKQGTECAGYGSIPLSHSENVIMRIGLQQFY